jgi:hypothetical protein
VVKVNHCCESKPKRSKMGLYMVTHHNIGTYVNCKDRR